MYRLLFIYSRQQTLSMIVNCAAYAILLALALGLHDVSAVQLADIYAPDLAGKYCEARTSARQKCCIGRQDDCSAPILGTLCYCDDFCNRTRNDDCCPDFWTFCKGLLPPEPITRRKCESHGRFYDDGETVKFNCNLCKCQSVNNNKMELLCETKLCLVDEEIIERVNRNHRNYGWRASNYSTFWGHYYEEGLTYRLGTILSKKKAVQMLPINPIFDPSSLPREFDARTKWSGKISEPKDQEWCGASWAFSTVAVASDRFSIALGRLALASNHLHSRNADDSLLLSTQHLVNCNTRQRGCQGGYLTRAWNFVRKFGLVPDSCYPWDSSASKDCRIRKYTQLTEATCPSVLLYGRGPSKAELHRVGPAYRLSGEQDIMYEIMESGPVQATMRISRDFFSYSSGIYRCITNLSRNDRSAFHSVRIVGWGEEYNNNQLTKYWIVSNSWGVWWGERGYFRIRRGINECQIEEFVLAAWVNIESLNTESQDQTQAFMEYDAQDLTNRI